MRGSIPGPLQCVKRPSIASTVAWIQSLATEFPYTVSVDILKKTGGEGGGGRLWKELQVVF